MLSLAKAIGTRRLSEFIDQEETRGIGPADSRALDALIAEAAKAPRSKAPRSEDQTSRSPSGDGSTGK